MKRITSRENQTYRDAVKLLRRKYREEMGSYLLEGIKPLRDALEAGGAIEKLFIQGGRFKTDEEGSTIRIETDDGPLTICQQEGSEVILLDEDLFEDLTDTDNSQGLIARIKIPDIDPDVFISGACKGNILLLDRLQDPGNVGTIIRTAEAAGITGILALKGTADIYAPKVVRAAAGTLFRMPLLTGITEEEALNILEDGGWKLAVSTPDGGVDCFSESFEDRICLAVGNEGAGISENLATKADMRLMIPMDGEIESLNVAMAAGIMMYRLRNI